MKEIMLRAFRNKMVIPGFNIPYLPMMEPIVRALADTSTFGLIMVARLEWTKFQSKSLRAIHDEYKKLGDPRYTRLHLDHVPVVDEDNLRTDYEGIIGEALELGYHSVMVDGSRLSLAENIACTRKITYLAHQAGIPVESELGAVLGHESGPLPPYEELFTSGSGFTAPDEAARFVRETDTDWLSVAVGNIHGAISAVARTEKKVEARLDIAHLRLLREKTAIPLVLHGGTGIGAAYLSQAFKEGISKINIATALRQPYEKLMHVSVTQAQEAVYHEMVDILVRQLGIAGSAGMLTAASAQPRSA